MKTFYEFLSDMYQKWKSDKNLKIQHDLNINI